MVKKYVFFALLQPHASLYMLVYIYMSIYSLIILIPKS